jgi:phage terminase small subunit
MKAGQRPMPTQLKLLRGNPGKQRLPANEPQPAQAIDVPAPPPFITGYAADEWWTVGTELHRLGLLTKVDCAPPAAYCYAYGQWRLAAESLARMAANDPIMNGQIIKTKYGEAAQNPLVSIARKHASDMVRLTKIPRPPLAVGRIASHRGRALLDSDGGAPISACRFRPR